MAIEELELPQECGIKEGRSDGGLTARGVGDSRGAMRHEVGPD